MSAAQPASALARLVSVLLFAGVPALALALAAANLAAVLSGRAEVRENERLLAALTERLDVLDPQGALDTSQIYLRGDTPSLAAAELRTRLAAAIAEAGGNLVETRGVDPDPSEAQTGAVELGATFDIGNAGLARLLYALESGTPLIEVANLALRRTDAENRDEDPLLRADLTVRAYRQGDAP